MSTHTLIDEAISLPIEDRALIVELLLSSLNHPKTDVDAKWSVIAAKRLADMRSGKVVPVDGQQVFNRVWSRFEK